MEGTGGGKGMRRVDRAEEFAAKYQEAALEAEKAFKNAGLYPEKYIVDGRHIEFQVMADAPRPTLARSHESPRQQAPQSRLEYESGICYPPSR